MACPWHQAGPHGRWARICRRCTPKVLKFLAEKETEASENARLFFNAAEALRQANTRLARATGLLGEVAAIFKRGRYPRPLSNRIVAFLEGPE